MAKHQKHPEPLPQATEAPTVLQVIDPWWECRSGNLPKADVRAPNADAAKMLYRQRLHLNPSREVTAKQV